MALLSATKLSKSFGPDDIFEEINLSISKHARVAIVGPNGIGKSTLLRILAGIDSPTQGSVQTAKNIRVGFLSQETSTRETGTLWALCMKAFQDLIEKAKKLSMLETEMAEPIYKPELLNEYGKLQHLFEIQGGYTFEYRIKQTLSGLGFDEKDHQRPIEQLSGGQKTRAMLAKLLLENPDILLLDEPTNHLDIDAVEWLESYLKDWEGAVVVVSHDRYFLDQVSKVIWEMTPTLEIYHGNYTSYLHQREERYTRRLAEYKAQSEYIEKEEEYIQKNISGQNTNQAQGRRRRLNRLLEESRLLKPNILPRRMHMHLNSGKRSGELVLRTYNLQIGYRDDFRPLFYCPDLLLERLECTAIIGPNGVGKTTFLKTILNVIPPYSGETQIGASIKIGYFAQAHEDLDSNKTLMEEIESIAPQMLPAEARNYLAKYLFSGDDVFRQVSTLSGGEKGRLALAKLALSEANLLLLDEPTNHLDLPTQEVLQSILSNYTGTVILVSHDRYLIDALATQIWEISPEHGTLSVFKGSYTEYHQEKLKVNQNLAQLESELTQPKEAITFKPSEKNKTLSRNQKQQIHKRMSQLEDELNVLNEEIKVLSYKLQNPLDNPSEVQHIAKIYNKKNADIERLSKEWESLASKLV